jgi:hypothetical protein
MDPDAPNVYVFMCIDGSLYTVIMADPDAPGPDDPSRFTYLHWIRKDLKGKDLSGILCACVVYATVYVQYVTYEKEGLM